MNNLTASVLFFVLFCSCGTLRKQNVSYISMNVDTAAISQIDTGENIIQIGDLLNIVVYSDNPLATSIYNQPLANSANRSTEPSYSSINPAIGYLVDHFGNIQFQSIGHIHVAGMTKQQLSDTLVTQLRKYLVNPYCAIRMSNYKITVMGEVLKPNSYIINNEKVNVLEAIGLAGDLTLFGRRDNVKVVRESNGKRTIKVLDLRDPKIFNDEYYQLQQNDIVIVDQQKNKQQANDQATIRNISIFATIASTAAIIFSALRR